MPSAQPTLRAAAQRARGRALGKPRGPPSFQTDPWWATSGGLGAHACPPLCRSPFYFLYFQKEHPPDSLPNVIDAGGGSFSQSLAFDLASRGGAVVAAAVSGTPPGAVRACADFAANSRARFCKQSGATSQFNNWECFLPVYPDKPLAKHRFCLQ